MSNLKGQRRHGGILLDAGRDEMGWVEVVRHGRRLSLHFGSAIEQSSHRPDCPDWLQFEYNRLLLWATAFPERADDVLLLGLGGGSLARYLLACGDTGLRLDAVEYRELVADMAFRHFDLPIDARFQVYIAGAERFVETSERHYDVVLVDLYDADGMNDEARRARFLETCRDRLRSDGVMAINLWRTDPREFRGMAARLQRVFDGRVLLADADDANTVAYCFRGDLPAVGQPYWDRRLREAGRRLGFDVANFRRAFLDRRGDGNCKKLR